MSIGIIRRNIFFKLYKKYIYSKLINFRIHTVSVRGKITKTNQEFRNKIGFLYIKNIKEVEKKIKENQYAGIKNILEIGFGDGEHLLGLAKNNTDKYIVGVELYSLGVILAAKKLHRESVINAHLIEIDARDVLSKFNSTFDEIYVLFPDPWRKKRHNKRRLIKKDFIINLQKSLSLNGKIIIATDWQDYADEIWEVLSEYNFQKVNIETINQTHFAKRAIREGRQISIWSGCL